MNVQADNSQSTVPTSVRQLLDELASLARITVRSPDLVVQIGKPDCCWRFNWRLRIITVCPTDLERLAPDLCRGLVLHEAAHAAITCFQKVLPPAEHRPIHALLNVIEDCRVETWLRHAFPGSAPWIRAYNDLFFGVMRNCPMQQARCAQFLRGILELWWFGAATPGMRPEVLTALDRCQSALSDAVASIPGAANTPETVLASQRTMWGIVRTRVLPHWRSLADQDRADGLEDAFSRESIVLIRMLGGAPGGDNEGEEVDRLFSSTVSDTDGDASSARSAISSSLGTDGSDAYLSAWQRIANESEQLSAELIRTLLPEQKMRWHGGHPNGARLDLRRAMQFSADPRLYRRLWSRPVIPNRRDPAFVLLVDRSKSMKNKRRMEGAFDGMVLMLEVCRRIGVPAAVWSFSNDCTEELAGDAPLDVTARRSLGRLLRSCDGGTRLAPALARVGAHFQTQKRSPKFLFVLSDGEPAEPDDVTREIAALETAHVHTIGLGLGEGTAKLSRFFQHAVTDIPPAQLSRHIGELITQALVRKS